MQKEHPIKPVKICFRHIGGKLGMLLLANFIENEWIALSHPTDKHYYITEKGIKGMSKMGLDLSTIKDEQL